MTVEDLTFRAKKLYSNEMSIGQFEIAEKSLHLGDLYGNRFTIVMRFIENLEEG